MNINQKKVKIVSRLDAKTKYIVENIFYDHSSNLYNLFLCNYKNMFVVVKPFFWSLKNQFDVQINQKNSFNEKKNTLLKELINKNIDLET